MKKSLLFVFLLFPVFLFSQKQFTRADTLRGSITPERAWWNVTYYDLSVEIDPKTKSLKGENIISYEVINPQKTMQIDLQSPMKIEKVLQDNVELTFVSEGNTHFIQLEKSQEINFENEITIHFSGQPKIAKNPPWDGGFTWTVDRNGNDWIANSNQGIGASVWWPLKDHPYDEPDRGMTISVTAPEHLMHVSNGQLKNVIENSNTKTWTWEVVNPINTYGVNISIGDYVHFGEMYEGEKGPLKMDYYVLRDHLEDAKKQFTQAPMMIEAFEHWFGPYPFYEDGYKLIQVPYLGMEHQSAVTYGNGFANGYLGRDLSGSGWGLKFDFILIHESGHEWFANNITNNDVAYMWIHEGFTCYSESLYLDYHFGKQAASEYIIGLRKNISNDRPMIGIPDLNFAGSSDIYYKGANILHTLRQIINNDEKWREILRGLNETFYHQTISSRQLEEYISKKSEIDLSSFWNQYLRTTNIPKLELRKNKNKLEYRFTNVLDNFTLPIRIQVNGKEISIQPLIDWQELRMKKKVEEITVSKDYYIDVEILN